MQEDRREREHQHWADHPVLHQRQAENPLVTEDLAQLFVADFSQWREHHDDEANGYGNICCPGLEAIHEGRGAGNKVPDAYPHGHREENPKGEVAIQERELLSLRRRADAAMCCDCWCCGHQEASQHCSERVVGKGAPSRAAYLEGEQQAFVRCARSACIALSSFSQSRVCLRICVAPICCGISTR